MERYDVLYTRNNLSKIISRVEAGEEIEISRRGRPVAKIVPLAPKRGLTGREIVEWLEQNPIPERRRKTAAEVDEIIREVLEGREDGR
ncbi:type II toxin-antitoxin system Phd/YefM family antitoxin [Herbiconiux liangxiaofengii]|uniref:type II toxin-antitoxin system Phd/YefM family antitoxin n=1 Tax=Herbiconiux liangxiaofengii TaxID=3342795 RepID=UPI0035B83D51